MATFHCKHMLYWRSKSVFVSRKLGVSLGDYKTLLGWIPKPNMIIHLHLQWQHAPLHSLLELGVVRFFPLGRVNLVAAGGRVFSKPTGMVIDWLGCWPTGREPKLTHGNRLLWRCGRQGYRHPRVPWILPLVLELCDLCSDWCAFCLYSRFSLCDFKWLPKNDPQERVIHPSN